MFQVPTPVDAERPLYFEMTETQILADLSALYTQAYQAEKWNASVQAVDAIAHISGLYDNRRHFYQVSRSFGTLSLRHRDHLIADAPRALAKMAAEKVGIFEEAVSKAQKELDPETLRRYIEVGYGAKA